MEGSNILNNHSFLSKILVCIIFSLIFFIIFDYKIAVSAKTQFDDKIYSSVTIDENFDDESLIVVLDKEISSQNKKHTKDFFKQKEIDQIIDLTAGDYLLAVPNQFEQVLKLTLIEKGKRNVLKMIKKIEKIPGIKYVGPNRYYETEKDVNDPYVEEGSLAGLNKIDIPNAWNITTGTKEVLVGVIDSGIASHDDLNENVTTGFDCITHDDVTTDDATGHGTFVAGIIGGKGDSATRICGVNWNITMVPLQVRNMYTGLSSEACVRAVKYATESYTNGTQPIEILNFSIGMYKEWPELEAVIRQYPGLFVCSTGNGTVEGEDINNDINHHYPSFYGSSLYSNPIPNIISVGRTDNNDEIPYAISNGLSFGEKTISIYAPGQNIISTYPTQLDSSGYNIDSGSSFSTPLVTGVAALLKSIYPHITPIQIKNAILNSADDIWPTFPDDLKIHKVKRLNAAKAVKYVLDSYSNIYTLQTNTIMSDTIDSTGTSFFEKNSMIKLIVDTANEYTFEISSTHAIDITLYDSSLSILTLDKTYSNNNTIIEFKSYLPFGVYYLKTNYLNPEANGTINIISTRPTHIHKYLLWTYKDNFCHVEKCKCGETGIKTAPHAIKASDVGNRYANCIGCNHLLDLTYDIAGVSMNSILITKVSINGSYLLPSGIIVLVEEDIASYLNGTFIFYDKNNIPFLS